MFMSLFMLLLLLNRYLTSNPTPHIYKYIDLYTYMHTVVDFVDGIEIIGFNNPISNQDHLTERGNHPLETSLLSAKPHSKFNLENSLERF